MNSRQHNQATRLLLGIRPHPGLHAFMDEYAKELRSAHRLLRHNEETIEFARKVYGEEGALEATFHIACDMGLVTTEDINWAKAKR
jgi:hypothetical protein